MSAITRASAGGADASRGRGSAASRSAQAISSSVTAKLEPVSRCAVTVQKASRCQTVSAPSRIWSASSPAPSASRRALACRAAGLEPIALEAKEGLALINGTQLSLALALDGLLAAETLLDASIVIGALTVDGLAGSYAPFDARIHEASRSRHQVEVARRFRLRRIENGPVEFEALINLRATRPFIMRLESRLPS